MSDISNRILALIEEKDISYRELSEITGIPKSALQRYSSGKTTKIPMDRVAVLARALDVTSEYLLGWNVPLPDLRLTPSERALVLSYRQADSGTRAAVEKLLDLNLESAQSKEA